MSEIQAARKLAYSLKRTKRSQPNGAAAMFRILSLDGGGIKGAFSAAVLATLEEDTGRAVVDHFDLITGTSTGGIIAIGLGLGIPAGEILKFYEEKGETIFPGTSLVQRARGLFRQFFKPKHSHDVLRAALGEVFGERKFGESKCRLVIPTYDAIGGRIFVMKTAHHERFKFDIDAPAVDVALATSAAPTYFAAAPFPNHANASYVDGGVWANSPVMVGLTEAVAFLGIPLDNIDILSIGTTTTPFNIAGHTHSGIAQWNAGLVELLFEGQMEAALAQAKLLLNGRLHRINVTTKTGEFSLDDAQPEKIQRLINLGRGEAVKKENLETAKARFLNGTPAAPFTPKYAVSA
jgi:patatin-like phospholipase/acyl hydrolase